MYTFSFIVGNVIPKSVKCIHSASGGYYGSLERGFYHKGCRVSISKRVFRVSSRAPFIGLLPQGVEGFYIRRV